MRRHWMIRTGVDASLCWALACAGACAQTWPHHPRRAPSAADYRGTPPAVRVPHRAGIPQKPFTGSSVDTGVVPVKPPTPHARPTALAPPPRAMPMTPVPVPPPRPPAAAVPPVPLPTPVPRPAIAAPPPQPPAAAPPAETAGSCVQRLAGLDIEAVPVADAPKPSDPLCVVAVPVVLVAIGRKTLAAPVVLKGRPELDCSAALVFGRFVHEIAAPLAKGTMGTPLTGIIAGGYQCRADNHLLGGHVSPHATGIALDIMGFEFADGRSLEIGKTTGAADGFVRGVRTAACGYFTTVLGPGANAAHANHLHFDIMHHGVGGDDHWRICQ